MNQAKVKNVLILDGYNLLFRARHSTKFKTETSTIFNFFRSLRTLYEKFNPDLTYFVLEGVPVKRLEETKKVFGEVTYKAQRVYEDKDNFANQRKQIIELLISSFPIKVIKHSEYECDDICNYLANSLHLNENTTIVSSDTDFIQSINENNKLYNPVRKSFIDKPDYDYVKFKALKGDTSDNIIGFKGIGDKTAIKLCNDLEKFNKLLSTKENLEKFNHNTFMIKFHDIDEKDASNINFFNEGVTFDYNRVYNKFTEYKFNSIIGKDNSWKKFVNTFQKDNINEWVFTW